MTQNNDFQLDPWSQFLVDEVKTQSMRHTSKKSQSHSVGPEKKWFENTSGVANTTHNDKDLELENILKLTEEAWDNVPLVVSDSIRSVVKEVQGMRSELVNVKNQLRVKENLIETMKEERKTFIADTTDALLGMENKLNAKPSISFVNACLNTKANKSDIYSMISPPPPIKLEALNERFATIEKKQKELLEKISDQSKRYCSVKMHRVLEHEIKILRNSIADNALDDQERCQNYEKRLEKLAQKGKKTYSGLTHLSTAMKALNKKLTNGDGELDEKRASKLKSQIQSIVDYMLKDSVDVLVQQIKENDENSNKKLAILIRDEVMSDTKQYVMDQIRKEQKVRGNIEEDIEDLRKSMKEAKSAHIDAVQKIEELGKEVIAEKHQLRQAKVSIHHQHEEFKMQMQKFKEESAEGIHKAVKEIHIVNNHTRDLPTRIASLHQMHSSSEKQLIDLEERLEKSTSKFEKIIDNIRRSVYTATRKVSTALKKEDCLEMIQKAVTPKVEFLDKRLTSHKKSFSKFAKNADVRKLTKKLNLSLKEVSEVTALVNNEKDNGKQINYADINEIKSQICDIEKLVSDHIQENSLETKRIDDEVVSLQDQLKSILRHGTRRLPEDDKTLPSEKGDVREKQLSTAFEQNVVGDYDGVNHRKETDLIIHSLRSQKTVLEQRLREMLNEPEQL